MTNEKQLNARLVQKHDTEVNWNKATNFIPKDGEIIVYDIDNNYDYKRIKIGDGITNIINLPFFTTSSNIIDNITSVEYELNVDNGILSPDIAGEYTEFTITKDNRADIGYTTEITDLVIPSAFVKDGVIYKVTSIGNVAFDGCDNLINVIIPNGVTSIGNSAFSWCDNLTSVIIPDGVISIGNYAFGCCPNLTNITIPNSVTNIGTSAFAQCTSLTKITIPKNVTTISESMLSSCTNLTSVTIPDSVTNIGDGAFNTCSNLTNIIIPNNVTNIGAYAFGGCSSLTNIVIPDSVTSIGNYAFTNCPNLTNLTIGNIIGSKKISLIGCTDLTDVTISNKATSIGDGAFYNCSKLNNINIPNSIISIGKTAFRGCSSLTNIIIPDSVTSMGDYVFQSCPNLTNIIIGRNVPNIGNGVFWGCGKLVDITIPNSITSIGDNAFSSTNLATIYYEGTKEEWDNIVIGANPTPLSDNIVFGYVNPSNLALKTDIPDVDSYITTHNTSTDAHNDIRDLITGLTNRLNALADSDDTTLDQLSEIVTYIKSNKELIDAITTSKVNVGDIVDNLTTNVSNKPLSAAQGVALKALIDAITVPTKVSELTNDSGYLTSYTETDPTVPAWAKADSKPTYTATEVGADATGTASSAVSTHNTSTESHPDIRELIENISPNIIDNTTGVEYGLNVDNGVLSHDISGGYTELTLTPSNISMLGISTDATEIVIPSAFIKDGVTYKVTAIEGVFSESEWAYTSLFASYPNLTSVTIPDSVTNIGNGTFKGCTNLTNITIPNSVTSINEYAFEGCTSLTSISIPDGITSISHVIFNGCTSLTSVRIPSSVVSIGSYAFNSCTNLTSVYYEGAKEQWDNISIGEGNDSLLNASIMFKYINPNNIVVPTSVTIGVITLTADGWVEDATLGAFKQTATIPNLANGHKVDLDADLNTINQLPASIVPYNDNGTFYAVTLTPPSVDIAVQYTLLATN